MVQHSYNGSPVSLNKTGQYLCLGDEQGILYIHSTETGELLRQLEHRQARYSVRMPLFSRLPSESLYQIGHSAHILRWQYVDPVVIEQYHSKQNNISDPKSPGNE